MVSKGEKITAKYGLQHCEKEETGKEVYGCGERHGSLSDGGDIKDRTEWRWNILGGELLGGRSRRQRYLCVVSPKG